MNKNEINKDQLPKLSKLEVEALIKYIRQNVNEDDMEFCCSSDAFDGALYEVFRVIREAYDE